jgi:enoyl-CoA hydratase/carnithine racemase
MSDTTQVDLGSPGVRAEETDGVLTVTIDRPEKRNAMSQDMYRALKRAAIHADRTASIHAVVLTGTGEWFAAGGDLSRVETVADLDTEWDGTDHFPFRHIERCRKIWIARINGACHAGGLGISLHCDVTIASDRATFRIPELLRGLPDPYIAERLVASVGLARARYLVFSARRFDAHDAERWGLIGQTVPHDDLDAAVQEVVSTVLSMGPTARTVMKREINRGLGVADPSIFIRVPSTEIAEGMSSFVERRSPQWPTGEIRA